MYREMWEIPAANKRLQRGWKGFLSRKPLPKSPMTFAFSNLIPADMERLRRDKKLKMFAISLGKMHDDGLVSRSV
jgi:hypothetical protein